VSFLNLLSHRATIRRRLNVLDRFGQPTYEFTDLAIQVPCRVSSVTGTFSAGAGGETTTDRSRDVVLDYFKVFLPPGQDILETDRIIVPGVLQESEVKNVHKAYDLKGEHHIEASCYVYRSGDVPVDAS
jgi:hypothetical protein